MLYKKLIRPRLFRADPETAHERALGLVKLACRCNALCEAMAGQLLVCDRRLRQTVFGLDFPNPVGLAAGFDKNAVGINFWPLLGFGFVELGSVTARPQDGNPPPRLFRLVEQQALVNRMGFNNDGAAAIAARVPPPPHRIPVGINVGKSRDVELAEAAGDYAETILRLRDRADFFVINVSSPNTPGLRRLQQRQFLDELLAGLMQTRRRAAGPAAGAVPVLLKIAPDLTPEQMDEVVVLAFKHNVAGIVAVNTTLDHPAPPEGGLSGAPLRARATECVRHLRRQTQGRLPIVGVGGIFTAEDAYEKIRAGANLVEVWTGMIYEGPAIARNINRGLLQLLQRDGFGHVAEAVGTEENAGTDDP